MTIKEAINITECYEDEGSQINPIQVSAAYDMIIKEMLKWVRESKGITKIDIIELINYLPEFKGWINDDEQWAAGGVICDLCGYDWIAVRSSEAHKIECPNCKNISTLKDE